MRARTSSPKQFHSVCSQPFLCRKLNSVKPRLHQIHVAGYEYPGRATCVRIQVDTNGCRRCRILADGDQGYNSSGYNYLYPGYNNVSGANAKFHHTAWSGLKPLERKLAKHVSAIILYSSNFYTHVGSLLCYTKVCTL